MSSKNSLLGISALVIKDIGAPHWVTRIIVFRVRLLGSVSLRPSPWVRQLSGLCGLVPLMVAPSLQLQLPGGLYESPGVFLDD